MRFLADNKYVELAADLGAANITKAEDAAADAGLKLMLRSGEKRRRLAIQQPQYIFFLYSSEGIYKIYVYMNFFRF